MVHLAFHVDLVISRMLILCVNLVLIYLAAWSVRMHLLACFVILGSISVLILVNHAILSVDVIPVFQALFVLHVLGDILLIAIQDVMLLKFKVVPR